MNKIERKNIFVGMSGGVDSSVAALLLKQQGHDVHGLFMKNWEEDDTEEYCNAKEDLDDAAKVCEQLNIPLHTVNFSSEYWNHVFDHFLDEYRAGRTPNPDILCNTEIKFKYFLNHAIELGADYIATGHYARLEKSNDISHLKKALDSNKDQSYFLCMLNQHQLSNVIFPLGEIPKPEVRAIAARHGFANHDKKDSTGICFIGERKFRDFLSKYIPAQPGNIENPEGDVIGEHQGLMYYTLGQRQGLGIGGQKHSSGEPWFVAHKDMKKNILVVVQGHDHPLLYHQALETAVVHWISGHPPEFPLVCHAKIRYGQKDQPCQLLCDEQKHCTVIFDEPQFAIAPGQAVVFYQNDECLGGATIEKIIDEEFHQISRKKTNRIDSR